MAEEDKSLENGEGGGEPKDWKAEARKWESRAKANFEKAKAYDEAQEAGKSELEKARAKAEKLDGELKAMKAKAERDALVAKVAKETGVARQGRDGRRDARFREVGRRVCEARDRRPHPQERHVRPPRRIRCRRGEAPAGEADFRKLGR